MEGGDPKAGRPAGRERELTPFRFFSCVAGFLRQGLVLLPK